MISVAIDGPSGAGKSSMARRLAAELGYTYVDTGAMYRAVGLYALRAGKDPADNAAVTALLPQVHLDILLQDGAQHVLLNGEDVSDAIRQEQVGMAASAVGANPAVRAFLLDTQRQLAKSRNVLMDGRDIGTVVLPDATVKIFLTASPEARADRRYAELVAKGRLRYRAGRHPPPGRPGHPPRRRPAAPGRGRRPGGHQRPGHRAELCRAQEGHPGPGCRQTGLRAGQTAGSGLSRRPDRR